MLLTCQWSRPTSLKVPCALVFWEFSKNGMGDGCYLITALITIKDAIDNSSIDSTEPLEKENIWENQQGPKLENSLSFILIYMHFCAMQQKD